MKLKQLLLVNGILFGGMGVALAVYAPLAVVLFGISEAPASDLLIYHYAVSFAHMLGAVLLTLGLLQLALTRLDLEAMAAQGSRSIASAMALGNAVAAILALVQQSGVWGAPVGWILTAVFALLTLGYGIIITQK